MEQSEDVSDYEKVKAHLGDKTWRLNNLYFIKDKNGNKVRFKLNWAQEKFHNEKHNRNIILKARQLGFTTYKCITKLDDVLFNSYIDAGIICHNVDDAEKIFNNKIKFAFDNLPEWLRKKRRPNTDRAQEYRFPNHSSISVSAGYRSGTLTGGLHVSEYAKMCKKYAEKAREVKSGAVNAVPIGKDIDFESTAEGMSGDFYNMCDRAMFLDPDKLTVLDYKFHFFPWFKDPGYRLNPAGIDLPKEMTDYFDYLKKEQSIALDDWQKAWYFKQSLDQDTDMHQEYPSYPEEAFLASGRPVFNQQSLAADIKRTKNLKHELVSMVVKDMEENEHIFQVKVFKSPDKAMSYAVAGDPAEGLEDGDNSALTVVNKDFEQVASFAGKLDPDLFAALLVEVAKYFNNALLAWETNNHGHAVEMGIKRRKYYKLFRRKSKEKIGEEVKEFVGWQNNVKTKMEMLDKLKECYRDESLTINDEETLREMLKCVLEEDGNIIVNGKDRVVCLGIALVALPQASIDNSTVAIVPHKASSNVDITKLTINQKLAHYKRRARE